MSWRSIALILVCVSTTVALQLKIRPAGSQFTKPLGSSIVLTCEALGLEAEGSRSIKLQWIGKDGKEVSDSSGRLYVETDGPTIKKLYITSIEDGDNGTYSCSGSLDGATETKTVSLQLIKDITFDLAPSPQNPKIFTDGLVVCRVSANPRPSVSWRHKGRRISSDNRYTLEDGALRIRNITQEDNGIYICRAEVDSDGRYDERKIAVIVYIPPKITSIREIVESAEDREAIISCKATGFPKPKYEFYKDRQKITNSSHIQVNSENGSLHLLSVKKEDKGTYLCQAVNEVGEASEEVELKVLVAPFIYEMKNLTVTEGDTASIDCLSQGDPEPVLSFFKGRDTEEIKQNEDGRISVIHSPGQVTLIIRDIVLTDAALYTCSSINAAGHNQRISRLTINYKPRFEPGLSTLVHSWEGRMQNISCHSYAHPTPSIEWLHNDEILTSNITYHLYDIAAGISTLEISIEDADQDWVYGNYTCRARNELGEAEHQIELAKATVPEPPEARVDERSPNHLVIVTIPNSGGGMRVTGYSVEYGTTVQEFTRLTTQDDLVPMPLLVDKLKSNTTYVFRIYAKNEVGTSRPTELLATTDEIRPVELSPAAASASISMNVVIGIIIGVFTIILLIIDISCYFVNGCGLTMCICVQLCGRTKPKTTPNEMEEGESKEILKETPPDLEVDEAKSSQEDLEEEKQHLAAEREIFNPQMEVMEELDVSQRQPPVEEPQPEERRGPLNRKSILSYGDGRWKDVVHELETQLGVKKTRSDEEDSDEDTKRDYDDDTFELH